MYITYTFLRSPDFARIESVFYHKTNIIKGESISEYSFKRGYKPESDRIRSVIEEVFEIKPTENEGKMTVSYGAIKEMKAWVQDKKLYVETQSDLAITDEKLILETNKRFRDFLEEATGYTAKERLKAAKKAVSGE